MKKYLGLVTSVVIATIIIGSVVCLVNPTKVVAGEVLRFDFVTHGEPGCEYWAVLRKGAEDAAKAVGGCKVTFYYNPADMPGQVATFDHCRITSNGIALVASDATAFDSGIQDCLDKGLPIVMVDSADMEWEPKGVPFIGAVPFDEGYTQGTYLAKVIKERGITKPNVLITGEVMGEIFVTETGRGFLKALSDAGVEYTDDWLETSDDPAVALGRVTDYLAGHPELNVIFGTGGISSESGPSACRDVGKDPGELVVSGVDLLSRSIEGLKSGYMTSSTTKQQYLQGYYATVELYQEAKFGFTAAPIHIIPRVITKENIGEVEELAAAGYY